MSESGEDEIPQMMESVRPSSSLSYHAGFVSKSASLGDPPCQYPSISRSFMILKAVDRSPAGLYMRII